MPGTLRRLRRMATDTHAALAAQLAEDAAERFLRYVRIDTQSDEDSETYPSTAKQLDLLRLLADELQELGLDDVGDRRARLRHGDAAVDRVARDADDRVLRARRHGARGQRRERQAAALPLRGRRHPARRRRARRSGRASRRSSQHHVGHELITTDGTTLLGADDKAGIAEIMAAVAYLQAHPRRAARPGQGRVQPRRGDRPRRHPLPGRHVRRGRRVHGRRLDGGRGAERDVLRRAGADDDPRPRDPSRAGRRARW